MKIQQLMQAHGMSVSKSKQDAITMMNGLIQQKAIVTGMNDAFMLTAFLTAFGVILVLFYKRKKHEEVDGPKQSQVAMTD